MGLLAFAAVLALAACSEDDPCENCGEEVIDGPIEGVYDPQTYELDIPEWLDQQPILPDDNPLTVEGVALGRRLFYDPILSADSTISCASCHRQSAAFTDGLPVSIGIDGIAGVRNAMSLVNLGWNPGKFFWDGRSPTLEDQALIPVEDHREMAEDWENVEEKLRRHAAYPQLFRAAFGIDFKSELTRDLVVKALGQFERTMISFDSRFDKVVNRNEGWFTPLEERGRDLFFIEFANPDEVSHPGCSHCHFNQDFTDHNFHNNGLDDVDDLADFPDPGLGAVTNNYTDYGKFKVPSLRNIELTAPYMHDGRFATLEEVLENYSRGGHGVSNENVNIAPFELSEEDMAAMVAFLKTLTDTSFVNNPALSNPFE